MFRRKLGDRIFVFRANYNSGLSFSEKEGIGTLVDFNRFAHKTKSPRPRQAGFKKRHRKTALGQIVARFQNPLLPCLPEKFVQFFLLLQIKTRRKAFLDSVLDHQIVAAAQFVEGLTDQEHGIS